MKPAHLQALFARRREIEHNRIERTEAANRYFDHWGRVTARFENWTAPEYYQQAEKQLQQAREQKEKQKRLQERQQKLSKLLTMENKLYEEELNSPRRFSQHSRLEKLSKNIEATHQLRRKLEREADLYAKWRHGVKDGNLLFESKSDNEVLAKLHWLDQQVDQQFQKEREQQLAKEHELKLQHEINKTEELQKERQLIREKEIHEIRFLQEKHMDQLKEYQHETDTLIEKGKQLKSNLEAAEKEIELLEKNLKLTEKNADFGQAYNLNKIKLLTRQRSEMFRHQIKICLSIVERTLNAAEKPETFEELKKRFENDLEKEAGKMTQFETMYESEAKHCLKFNEELWQAEHNERYQLLKQALMQEHYLIKSKLNDIMKKHEELLELKSTHLRVIESSNEKLKHLIQENEGAQSSGTQHRQAAQAMQKSVELSHRYNCDESNDNNLSPRCFNANDCNDINQASNSFNNLNLNASHGHISKQDLEMEKTNAQRTMQVVTAETEADRPRFGRRHLAWN